MIMCRDFDSLTINPCAAPVAPSPSDLPRRRENLQSEPRTLPPPRIKGHCRHESASKEGCKTRWSYFLFVLDSVVKNRIKVKKVNADMALHGNPISELRDVTCHMGSHSVTCHSTQVNAPHLTPAMQAGTQFTYPGGI